MCPSLRKDGTNEAGSSDTRSEAGNHNNAPSSSSKPNRPPLNHPATNVILSVNKEVMGTWAAATITINTYDWLDDGETNSPIYLEDPHDLRQFEILLAVHAL